MTNRAVWRQGFVFGQWVCDELKSPRAAHLQQRQGQIIRTHWGQIYTQKKAFNSTTATTGKYKD